MSSPSLLLRLLRQIRRWVWLARTIHRSRHHAKCAWLFLCRKTIPAACNFGPPRGWFSIYDQVKNGSVSGRVVLAHQPAPIASPNSLRCLARLGQEKPMNYPVFWSRHHNARLVGPTLLLMDDHKRVSIESAWGKFFLPGDPGYQQFRRPSPIHLSGNWTSIISYWSRGFHHWVIDTLPRLALLGEFPPDTRVLVPDKLQPYQIETLGWLGLLDRTRPTSEQHIVVENYYFSSPSVMSGGFAPYAIESLRRMMLDRRDNRFTSSKNIYIHRRNAARGIVNDDEVAAFFGRQGWEIFDTEQLTMAEQIQLFANAEQVCTLHGAALTNLVWCQPGTRVIEIVASTFVNGVYEGIAEAAGLDYRFLFCPGDTKCRARVNLSELATLLK